MCGGFLIKACLHGIHTLHGVDPGLVVNRQKLSDPSLNLRDEVRGDPTIFETAICRCLNQKFMLHLEMMLFKHHIFFTAIKDFYRRYCHLEDGLVYYY